MLKFSSRLAPISATHFRSRKRVFTRMAGDGDHDLMSGRGRGGGGERKKLLENNDSTISKQSLV